MANLYDRLNYIKNFDNSQLVDPLDTTLPFNYDRLVPTKFHYVTSGQEGRPDYVSFKLYRTVELWWFIMDYNGILHNLDLVSGLKLNYVSLTALNDYLSSTKTTFKTTTKIVTL